MGIGELRIIAIAMGKGLSVARVEKRRVGAAGL